MRNVVLPLVAAGAVVVVVGVVWLGSGKSGADGAGSGGVGASSVVAEPDAQVAALGATEAEPTPTSSEEPTTPPATTEPEPTTAPEPTLSPVEWLASDAIPRVHTLAEYLNRTAWPLEDGPGTLESAAKACKNLGLSTQVVEAGPVPPRQYLRDDIDLIVSKARAISADCAAYGLDGRLPALGDLGLAINDFYGNTYKMWYETNDIQTMPPEPQQYYGWLSLVEPPN